MKSTKKLYLNVINSFTKERIFQVKKYFYFTKTYFTPHI